MKGISCKSETYATITKQYNPQTNTYMFKTTIEPLEKGVDMFNFGNKDTGITLIKVRNLPREPLPVQSQQ